MDEEQQEAMASILWRMLIQLKRVCVLMNLKEPAQRVSRLLDELEDMMEDDDGTKDDVQEKAHEEDDDMARRPDVPRGKPSGG